MCCGWTACVSVWLNACGEFVCECVSVYFSTKKTTQWSYLIWSEISSTPIRNDRKALASLHGDEQRARTSSEPPRFMLWSEVMKASDILVLGAFGFISSVTTGHWVNQRFWSNHNWKAARGDLNGWWFTACVLLTRRSLCMTSRGFLHCYKMSAVHLFRGEMSTRVPARDGGTCLITNEERATEASSSGL